MIQELRTYHIEAGKMQTYLDRFERLGLPLLSKHLTLLAAWTVDTGELNRFHHLWGFQDVEDRSRRWTALRNEPTWWSEFVPSVDGLIKEMTSTILKPTSFSPMFKGP